MTVRMDYETAISCRYSIRVQLIVGGWRVFFVPAT